MLDEAGRFPVIGAHGVSAGRVVGDRRLLARLVRNLCDNAVRHARTGVTVSLAGDERTVTLLVEDDGAGIPAADRERVFERFTRLEDGRMRDGGHAGLGLAMVRRIAEQHGGRVKAEAGCRGGGARFVVELPAVSSGEPAVAAARRAPAGSWPPAHLPLTRASVVRGRLRPPSELPERLRRPASPRRAGRGTQAPEPTGSRGRSASRSEFGEEVVDPGAGVVGDAVAVVGGPAHQLAHHRQSAVARVPGQGAGVVHERLVDRRGRPCPAPVAASRAAAAWPQRTASRSVRRRRTRTIATPAAVAPGSTTKARPASRTPGGTAVPPAPCEPGPATASPASGTSAVGSKACQPTPGNQTSTHAWSRTPGPATWWCRPGRRSARPARSRRPAGPACPGPQHDRQRRADLRAEALAVDEQGLVDGVGAVGELRDVERVLRVLGQPGLQRPHDVVGRGLAVGDLVGEVEDPLGDGRQRQVPGGDGRGDGRRVGARIVGPQDVGGDEGTVAHDGVGVAGPQRRRHGGGPVGRDERPDRRRQLRDRVGADEGGERAGEHLDVLGEGPAGDGGVDRRLAVLAGTAASADDAPTLVAVVALAASASTVRVQTRPS